MLISKSLELSQPPLLDALGTVHDAMQAWAKAFPLQLPPEQEELLRELRETAEDALKGTRDSLPRLSPFLPSSGGGCVWGGSSNAGLQPAVGALLLLGPPLLQQLLLLPHTERHACAECCAMCRVEGRHRDWAAVSAGGREARVPGGL